MSSHLVSFNPPRVSPVFISRLSFLSPVDKKLQSLPVLLTFAMQLPGSRLRLDSCCPSLPCASACPPPSSRICNPPPVRQDLQSSRPSRLSPRGCNCASQTRKVCSASIQSARCGKLRTGAGCGLQAREACPPFPPREPQCRVRRHTSRLQCRFTVHVAA